MREINPNIEKISLLSQRQIVIGAAIVLGLYYMFMYEDGIQLESGVKTAKQNIKKIEGEIQSYKKAEEDAKIFRAAIEKDASKFDAIVKYMPAELSEFEVMEMLSTEVKAAGGRVKSSSAIKKNGGDNQIYNVIEATMSLEISYSQFLLFLSYITKLEKIITLSKLSLKRVNVKIEGETLLNVDANFEAYQYSPKNKGNNQNAK